MKKKLVALVCALGLAAPVFAAVSPTVIPLYSLIPIHITSIGDRATALVFQSEDNFQGDIGKFAETEKSLIEHLQSRGCKLAFAPTRGGYGSDLINITEAQVACKSDDSGDVVVTLTGSLKTPSGTDGLKSLEVGDDAIFLVQKSVTF